MTLLYIAATCLIAALYTLLILYLRHQWENIPEHEESLDTKAPPLSILLPARNEALHIGPCLDSLLHSIDNCPRAIEIEIIVIDDHSDDTTAQIVHAIQSPLIKLIQLKDQESGINAHKKVALAAGLKQATGDYIIQLDADILVSKKYIQTVAAAIATTQADMITGPVILSHHDKGFEAFQTLDMVGMMGLTAVGIHTAQWYLANGANLIYRKGLVAFEDSALASGDDVFAIQSAAKKGAHINFLKSKEAAITTAAVSTVSAFYRQRIRWATKNKYSKNPKMMVVMAIPYLSALMLLAHLPLAYFFGPLALVLGGFHLLSKLGIDYIYLSELSKFFRVEESVKHFGYSGIAHILYLLVIGTLSFGVKQYEWKGRRVQ